MSVDVPDLVTLRILAAIGATGTFGRAASGVGISQQAASSRIRAAESQLGFPLVHRTSKGSTLTTEGQLLVEWSSGLLEAADRLALALRTLRPESAIVLTVAASQTIAEHFLPPWMAEFRRRSGGGSSFRLTSGNSLFVIEEVRRGAATVGLIETPDVPSDLSSAKIRDDELAVVVSPEHRWARMRKPLSAAQLASAALVLREPGSGTRRTLELALAVQDPERRLAEPAAVLATTGAIRAAVVAGIAPAVLSAAAVQDDMDRGLLRRVRVADLTLTRPLTALWRPTVPLPRDAEILFSILTRPSA